MPDKPTDLGGDSVFTSDLGGTGTFDYKVAGTSIRQAALLAAGGTKLPYQQRTAVTCRLQSEPTNPHDRNAVRVEINGQLVGYLPRNYAANLSQWLHEHNYSRICADVAGVIVGGWERVDMDGYSEGAFGVRIDAVLPGYTPLAPSIATNEDEFRPMLQVPLTKIGEMWHAVDQLGDSLPLCPGDWVSLWSPEDSANRVFIYLRGSLAGSGKLGLVPSPFAERIIRHRGSGLKVECHIFASTTVAIATCNAGFSRLQRQKLRGRQPAMKHRSARKNDSPN